MNDEFGEFWYDLKLSSLDPLPVALEPIEAEVGRYSFYFIQNLIP